MMPCEIRFLPSNRTIAFSAQAMTLLEATRSVDLPIASACGGTSTCARCGLEILAGHENLVPESEHERVIKELNRIDPSLRLACRIRPTGNLTVRAPYW